MKAFVKSQELTTTTTFTGYADNVEEYLSASDISVYPSENEALGVAIIEAVACGLPVIASGVGGIPDLVVLGETGILINPRRSDQIREALRSVIVNASRRKEMGLKDGHHAKTYFSIDRINSLNVQAFTAVYRSKALPS